MKMHYIVFPGCVLLVCLWTSCGRSLSSSDAVASEYAETVPALPRGQEGVTVRPDVLVLSFAFRQEAEDLDQALPKLKEAAGRYVRAVTEATRATKVEVSMKMRDFGQDSGRKLGGNAVVAIGLLEVSLPESLDFWGRAELVATLTRLGMQEAAAAEKANTGLRASFDFPSAQVRNPEAHRAELTTRWVERARAFMFQAQSERAPLQVVNCEPPGQVTQQSLSVDEVVLSLAVSCRLDAVVK